MPHAKKKSLRHHLAHRLRELREAHGWSQEDLAQVSGLHRTYVSLIERRRCNVSLDNLERLAEALDVPAAELLTPDPRRLSLWPLLAREPRPAYVTA